MLRRDLKASFRDGLFWSLTVGLGESFLVAFVLAQGFSETAASLMATAPLFIGSVFQLWAPAGAYKLGSFKKWVLWMAAIQAVSLMILAILALSHWPFFLIFITVSIYWTCNLAMGPSWNTWLSQIIKPRVRISFFATRSKYSHLMTFVGLALSGLILHLAKQNPNIRDWMTNIPPANLDSRPEIAAYAIIFGLAAISRLISFYFLSQHSTPHASPAPAALQLTSLFKLFRSSSTKHFMFFMFLFQLSSNVSSGLFSPFMLKQLQLSYFEYMSLLAAALLSRFATLTFAKPLIQFWGIKKVFYFSLFLISPIPMLWTKTSQHEWFYIMQMISGAGWGLYELVTFLTLFNDVPQKDKAGLLSFFNLLQTSGILLGSLLGVTIFHYYDRNFMAYDHVFSTSTSLRLLTCLALPGLPWHLIRLRTWIEMRPIGVRAQGGLLERPIFVRMPIALRRRKKK